MKQTKNLLLKIGVFSLGLFIGLPIASALAQESSFTTSNDRSLYDAQTRALQQKARTQLQKDTAKLKELKEDNEELDTQTTRIRECANLDKVYNGDPTDSNDVNVYCQSIVGAIPSQLNLKGLMAWYDVSTEDSYELDGSAIAKLFDKSGNLNHLEASGSSRPEIRTHNYAPKAGNSIKVMYFDGNDYLKSTSNKMATATGIKGNYGASIFAVFNHNSSATGNSFGVMSLGSPAARSCTGILNYWQERYGVHHSSMGYAPNMKVSKNRLVLMDYHKEKDAEPIAIYVNSTLVGEASMGTPNVQDGPILVGRWADSGYNMRGDIAEIIIYNRKLTSSERASVQAYLTGKYSLQPFNTCANTSINTGQCTTATGTANHGESRNLGCSGTFGTCTTEQYCNDGTWEQKSSSCPPPANCAAPADRSLGQCNANTGTGNHGAVANLSCSGAYGTCTGTSSCYNGAWNGATGVSCPAPAACNPATTFISSPHTSCQVNLTTTSHNVTRNLSCTSSLGLCTANIHCSNGVWQPMQNQTCPTPPSYQWQSFALHIDDPSINTVLGNGSGCPSGSVGTSCSTKNAICFQGLQNNQFAIYSQCVTPSEVCVPSTVGNCRVDSFGGNASPGMTVSGVCTNNTYGDCKYKCTGPNWQQVSNSCAKRYCPSVPSNTLLFRHKLGFNTESNYSTTTIASLAVGNSTLVRFNNAWLYSTHNPARVTCVNTQSGPKLNIYLPPKDAGLGEAPVIDKEIGTFCVNFASGVRPINDCGR